MRWTIRVALASSLMGGCTLLVDTADLAGESPEPSDGGASDALPSSPETGPACTNTQTDSSNCGRCGHTCGGDSCVLGKCQLTPVVTGQTQIRGLAVDDAGIFWTSVSGGNSIMSRVIGPGATPFSLITMPSPRALADVRIDGDYVGAINAGAGNGSASGYRVNKTVGGTAAGVGSCTVDSNSGLVFDSVYAYFANGVRGKIYRAAKTQTDCAEELATGQAGPRDVVVDDQYVYYTNSGTAGGIGGVMKVAKGGAAPAIPLAASAITAAIGIAMDGPRLFVTTADGRIVSLDKDGNAIVEIANGQGGPMGIVVDETNVYWVSADIGEVWMANKATKAATLLASSQATAAHIALGAGHVYWSTDTGIYRIAK